MIKIENVEVYGWEAAIRGMRNPLNSWKLSDSVQGKDGFVIGKNDYGLMERLVSAGSDHGKFMRYITVTADITARNPSPIGCRFPNRLWRCDMDAEKLMMQKRIDNLIERLEKVERERDALRYDMQLLALTNMCEICKYNTSGNEVCERTADKCFAWRGLCKENGGVEE